MSLTGFFIALFLPVNGEQIPRGQCAGIAPDHGHLGAADQLVSLGLHLERGDLESGDVVAMCGPSIGMHWCCTLIQV